MRKFEFKKSYEEVEIAGEVYKVALDDEKVLKYHEISYEYYLSKKKAAGKNINVSNEDLRKEYKEIRKMAKRLLDIALGEGVYEELYEKSGQSTLEIIGVVELVSDIVIEEMDTIKGGKKNKYIKKKI